MVVGVVVGGCEEHRLVEIPSCPTPIRRTHTHTSQSQPPAPSKHTHAPVADLHHLPRPAAAQKLQLPEIRLIPRRAPAPQHPPPAATPRAASVFPLPLRLGRRLPLPVPQQPLLLLPPISIPPRRVTPAPIPRRRRGRPLPLAAPRQHLLLVLCRVLLGFGDAALFLRPGGGGQLGLRLMRSDRSHQG